MNISKNKLIYLSRYYLSLIVFLNILFCTNLIAGGIPLSDSTKKQPDLTLLAFYQQGKVLPTNDFVRGNNLQLIPISRFRAFSFQLSNQTTGEELWEQLYNFPHYGFGIYSARFIHSAEIGKPVVFRNER